MNKRGAITGKSIIRSFRFIFILFFIGFCIFILVYHTFFESGLPEEPGDIGPIPEFLSSKSQEIKFNENDREILQNITSGAQNNTTIQLSNPNLIKPTDEEYLLAFEAGLGNQTTIFITRSKDKETWTEPTAIHQNLTGISEPRLKYVQDKEYILFFKLDGEVFITTSGNGTVWSTPTHWEQSLSDKAVFESEDYILATNQTGLWLSEYEFDSAWQRLVKDEFLNGSITKISDREFIVAHENSTHDFKSITLTTVQFKEPVKTETEIKWDLLILFIIIGVVVLALIIKEVSRE
jgi:hypothetical protein